jgi:uncharacterized protein YjiS (DUF1127 family)
MERAMTFTFPTHGVSRWSHVKTSIVEWRRRSLSRQELEALSDATLRDIGITRCDAHFESHKAFWMT